MGTMPMRSRCENLWAGRVAPMVVRQAVMAAGATLRCAAAGAQKAGPCRQLSTQLVGLQIKTVDVVARNRPPLSFHELWWASEAQARAP